jgi:hypothetical protein
MVWVAAIWIMVAAAAEALATPSTEGTELELMLTLDGRGAEGSHQMLQWTASKQMLESLQWSEFAVREAARICASDAKLQALPSATTCRLQVARGIDEKMVTAAAALPVAAWSSNTEPAEAWSGIPASYPVPFLLTASHSAIDDEAFRTFKRSRGLVGVFAHLAEEPDTFGTKYLSIVQRKCPWMLMEPQVSVLMRMDRVGSPLHFVRFVNDVRRLSVPLLRYMCQACDILEEWPELREIPIEVWSEDQESDDEAAGNRPIFIAEIGAGYGALAHVLSTFVQQPCRYVDFDLLGEPFCFLSELLAPSSCPPSCLFLDHFCSFFLTAAPRFSFFLFPFVFWLFPFPIQNPQHWPSGT